jgi:hypothetical protein
VEIVENCDYSICSFGGIACWQDPIQALMNIREALKPDGIFVMNHFDIDSLPGKVLDSHHFEYNHASLVIFLATNDAPTPGPCRIRASLFAKRAALCIVRQNCRIFEVEGRTEGACRVWLRNVTIPLIVPGTVFAICRRTPYSTRRRSEVFDPHFILAPTMRAA